MAGIPENVLASTMDVSEQKLTFRTDPRGVRAGMSHCSSPPCSVTSGEQPDGGGSWHEQAPTSQPSANCPFSSSLCRVEGSDATPHRAYTLA